MRVELEGLPEQPVSTSEIRRVLSDDLFACWAAVKREDSQLHRRNYVRAAFAFIEGVLAVMRSGALVEFSKGRASLTPGEVALLLEKTYSASDEGTALEREAFVPTTNSIRFTFTVFARTHGLQALPDYGDAGWRAVRQALKLRNRITHPKVGVDLDISDEELKAVDDAWDWFLDASFALHVEGKAALLLKLAQVKSEAAPSNEELKPTATPSSLVE